LLPFKTLQRLCAKQKGNNKKNASLVARTPSEKHTYKCTGTHRRANDESDLFYQSRLAIFRHFKPKAANHPKNKRFPRIAREKPFKVTSRG